MCIDHFNILNIIRNNSTYNFSDDLFFVDVGAHDGITWSNTYSLEKDHGWKGICIEPIKSVYDRLIKNRKVLCYNQCIYSKNTDVVFSLIEGSNVDWLEMLSGIESCYGDRQKSRVDNTVKENQLTCSTTKLVNISLPAKTLSSIFKENNLKEIHYLSIDTEGSELDVLKGIDFDEVKIGVISAENNWIDDRSVEHYLQSKNYKLVCRNNLDDVYAQC